MEGDGFQNFQNMQYSLDPASWYAPTPVMESPFMQAQAYENYQGTFDPSNTFGDFSSFNGAIDTGFYEQAGGVPLLPSFSMDQFSGVDSIPVMEQFSGVNNIPVMEQQFSGVDNFPIMEQFSGVDSIPVMDQFPGVDCIPVMDQFPGVDSIPVMDQFPGVDSIPVMEQFSGVDNINPLEGGQCSTWAQLTDYPDQPNHEDFNNNVAEPPKEMLQGGNSAAMNFTKRPWTKEEDSKLYALVMEFGSKDWVQIANRMEGRARKQCRKRWFNHVHPDIKKDDWSESEEIILVEAHQKMGNKWAEIARMIPGRTENAIKNHWNATKRKKTLRCRRSKKNESSNGQPRSTVLLDYIRGIGSTSASYPTNATNVSLPTITRDINVTQGNSTPILPDDLFTELENLFHNIPSNSYSIESPSLDMIIPTHDDESTFMQTLFGNNTTTTPEQPKITTSNETLVQPQEPISCPNMNTLGLNGNSENGYSPSPVPIDGISNIYLNNNSPTDMSTTHFSHDPYLSCPMDFTTMFSNSTDHFYDYGGMNFDLPSNAQGDIGSPDAPIFPIF